MCRLNQILVVSTEMFLIQQNLGWANKKFFLAGE